MTHSLTITFTRTHIYTSFGPNKQFIHANMVLLKMPNENMHHTNSKTKIRPRFFVSATERAYESKKKHNDNKNAVTIISVHVFIWFAVECFGCMRYVVFDTQLDRMKTISQQIHHKHTSTANVKHFRSQQWQNNSHK